MRSGVTGEGVRDLMQQHLMDVVVFEACGEIAGHGDALLRVVALPGPPLGVVEAERPAVVEVQRDQCFAPDAHTVKFRHAIRLSHAADIAVARRLSPR